MKKEKNEPMPHRLRFDLRFCNLVANIVSTFFFNILIYSNCEYIIKVEEKDES